jgi:hypothetical protein
VDATLFRQLLFEGESATLDFKQQQYPFVKASDDDKSELLKDILGFANAFRRSDAYILIGVEDVSGGQGNVLGIAAADHLQDHSLQQFVNNLTNRPVRFHYEAFGFEGKQVGIVRVEQHQPRPLFLKHDYGKLRKNEIYIRRGSSTDPTKPAGPDEIALMGQSSATQTAELKVEFADIDRDNSLGTTIAFCAENCEMPPNESIPELRGRGSTWDVENAPNRDFYWQFAEYEFFKRIARPVRLVLKNTGEVAANSVRLELTTPVGAGAAVRSGRPRKPIRGGFDYGSITRSANRALRPTPGEVSIEKNDERFLVAIEFGDIQPGRHVQSEVFYALRLDSGEVTLKGHVYAANLPQPEECTLLMSFTVTNSKMSVDDLTALADATIRR